METKTVHKLLPTVQASNLFSVDSFADSFTGCKFITLKSPYKRKHKANGLYSRSYPTYQLNYRLSLLLGREHDSHFYNKKSKENVCKVKRSPALKGRTQGTD